MVSSYRLALLIYEVHTPSAAHINLTLLVLTSDDYLVYDSGLVKEGTLFATDGVRVRTHGLRTYFCHQLRLHVVHNYSTQHIRTDLLRVKKKSGLINKIGCGYGEFLVQFEIS